MNEENDYGFYGEENDETVVQDIDGITDTVTNYTYTNLNYPCVLFNEGFTCPKHQMKVVSNMVNTGGKDKDISLYFQNEGEIYKLGMINGFQMKGFIDIIGLDNIIGFYDENTELLGDKLYTLCSF